QCPAARIEQHDAFIVGPAMAQQLGEAVQTAEIHPAFALHESCDAAHAPSRQRLGQTGRARHAARSSRTNAAATNTSTAPTWSATPVAPVHPCTATVRPSAS